MYTVPPLQPQVRVKHGKWACFCNGQLMYVVWAFIVILLFLHFDLSEIIAFAHYTSTASPLQKHAYYPCFTLSPISFKQIFDSKMDKFIPPSLSLHIIPSSTGGI